MARKTGSSSSVAIPLSKLVAKLNGNQIVKVSKGWLVAVQEANDIDFEVDTESGEDAPATATASADSASAASAPASDARPSVDIG